MTGAQQSLIDAPVRWDLVARAKSPAVHTGARALEDDDEVQGIAELLISGVGVKRVAALTRHSPHTIRAVRDALEEGGKLAPYKARMSRRLGLLIESCAEECQERLDRGDMPINLIPVLMGISSDKKALLDGEATSIVESRVVVLTPEKLAQGLKSLTIDCESEVSPT